MYLERHFKNTLQTIQSISETRRIKNGTIQLPRIRQIGLGPTPKTCQYIVGAPTKLELRRAGSESFKCSDPVKEKSVYCEAHHTVCYIKPLTKDDPT